MQLQTFDNDEDYELVMALSISSAEVVARTADVNPLTGGKLTCEAEARHSAKAAQRPRQN